MNMSTSDCSSGCESGWTMYLDQSSNSLDQFQRGNDYRNKRANVTIQHEQDDDDDEDEDLSMVSDASSGPRQMNDEEEESFNHRGYFGYASEQRNPSKQKETKEYRGKQSQRNSYLDDTASSPIFNISKEDQTSLEHVTSFKGKSTLKKHFGFLKPSGNGKAASDKSGGFQGRKRQ